MNECPFTKWTSDTSETALNAALPLHQKNVQLARSQPLAHPIHGGAASGMIPSSGIIRQAVFPQAYLLKNQHPACGNTARGPLESYRNPYLHKPWY